MATTNPSLFGMLGDEAAMQRQLDEQKAMQFANMTQGQRLASMGYRAGAGLGRGVASLFGEDIVDPAVRQASQIRQLASQFDTTTPEGMMQFARAVKDINPNMASQAAQQAQAMSLTAARTKSLTSGVGKLNPQNYTAESWAKYSESGNLSDLVDKPGKGASGKGPIGNISPKDFTPESMQAFLNSVQTGSPDYSLLERVKPAEKELPASLVAKAADIDANIVKLDKSVSKLNDIGSRIDKLDLGLVQNFARGGAAWAGINTKDRTEFDSLQRTARQEANNLLLLAKGAQTEGDAQRAQAQIADPDTWKNKDALKAAFQDLRDTHAATLEALKTSRSTITSPSKASTTAAGGYSQAQESLIQRWMAANKRSREEVISYLKSQGKL